MSTIEDERWGETVAELMWSAEVPATQVRPSDVLAEVRRSTRRRRWLSSGLAVVAVGAVAVSGTALGLRAHRSTGVDADRPTSVDVVTGDIGRVSCTVTEFRMPDGATNASLTAADDTGRFFAGRFTPKGGDPKDPAVALWTDGVPSVVPVPGQGGFGPYPHDVNSHGVVVGEGFESGANFAWEYRDGQLRKLPTLPGYRHWWAYAVNERGDIAGFARAETGDTFIAVVWPAGEPGSVRRLNAPQSAQAEDITDDGTVIGNLMEPPKVVERPTALPSPGAPPSGNRRTPPTIARKAYLWDADGRGRELPAAGTLPGQASMIRGDLVFGSTNGARTEVHPVRWDLRTGKVTIVSQVSGGLVGGSANREGWAAVTTRDGPMRISPAGAVDQLVGPASVSRVEFMAPWIGPDGRTLVANTEVANVYNVRPMTWHC